VCVFSVGVPMIFISHDRHSMDVCENRNERLSARGCYEPVASVGRVKPVGGFVFHSDPSSPLRSSDSSQNEFVAALYACPSSIRNGGRRTSATPPVKPMHDWHPVHNSLYGRSRHTHTLLDINRCWFDHRHIEMLFPDRLAHSLRLVRVRRE